MTVSTEDNRQKISCINVNTTVHVLKLLQRSTYFLRFFWMF